MLRFHSVNQKYYWLIIRNGASWIFLKTLRLTTPQNICEWNRWTLSVCEILFTLREIFVILLGKFPLYPSEIFIIPYEKWVILFKTKLIIGEKSDVKLFNYSSCSPEGSKLISVVQSCVFTMEGWRKGDDQSDLQCELAIIARTPPKPEEPTTLPQKQTACSVPRL